MNEKNHLRVSVPSSDGVNIFPGMLGKARYFFIYEILDSGEVTLFEKRDNPFEKTLQPLKTLDVYELIDDCSIIISARIGKKGVTRLRERGMRLIFKDGNIQKALASVLNNL
jgi:predicted Fe-Mo cluster-binding NifX family protein